jgi:cytosine/adenosine deaminase-related metal-dependent hydrolase
VTEDRDEILAATERAIEAFHDGGPAAMVRVAVAPCAPFTVSEQLMRESAELARRKGVRLHTHLAETRDEHDFCRERFGRTPVEYMESLGWLGGDVWMAHCVHVDRAGITRLGRTGTGVAHCPTSNLRLGAGVAPIRQLLDAGAQVGLGVDGSASNERSDLFFDVKQALLVARGRGGPAALTVREALRLATRGSAELLGRGDLGAIAPGRCADLAVWRADVLELAGSEDLVAGLVLSAPHRVERLLVGGEDVVRDGRIVRASEQEIAQEHRRQAEKFTL